MESSPLHEEMSQELDLQRVSDPKNQAEGLSNLYWVALERGDWTDALAALVKAATLDPVRFAPFPLDRYEPQRILGAGGFGVTFLCRDRHSEALVAVKTLRLDGLDGDVTELFRKAQVVKEFDWHPAVQHLRDFGFADQTRTKPYLVMDYFEGQSLAEYVARQSPLPPGEWLAMAGPVAEALQAAHALGVLHMAVKPANVLMHRDDSGWRVKLINFGLALKPALINPVQEGSPPNSALQATIAGTVPYLAPEQSGALSSVACGPYSDVFAFGKTCYFALLGTAEPSTEQKASLPPAWRNLLHRCTLANVTGRLVDFMPVLELLSHLHPDPSSGFLDQPGNDQASLAATSAGSGEPTQTITASGCLKWGAHFLNEGEWEKAVAYFSQALRLEPNNIWAIGSRGDAYRLMGQHERAIADLSQAIHLNPNNPLAYINRGIAYRAKGDHQQAIRDYDTAIQLDAKNALAFNNRGNAYSDQGAHDLAILDYTAAIQLDPDYACAYCNRGNAYADIDQYDRAILDHSKAVELDPENTVAWVNRGLAYRMINDYNPAIADFTRALELTPEDAETLVKRGNAYADKGDFQRAIADYGRAIELDPDLALAYLNRGLALAKKGDADAAIADCDAAIRLAPRLADAYFARGVAYAGKGDQDQAIADFSRALRYEPAFALAYNDRGLAFANLGHYHRAVEDYSEAIRLNPKLHLAYLNRGIAYRLLDQLEPAIADLTKALRLDLNNILAFFQRGLAFAARRDHDRAIADYDATLRLDPGHQGAQQKRAEALEAKTEWKRVPKEERPWEKEEEKERRQSLAGPYLMRGRMNFDNCNYDRAIFDYTEALKHDPYDGWIHYYRGLAHVALDQYDEAIADYTKAIRLKLRTADAYYYRGVAHRLNGDYRQAIADYSEAIRLDPKMALAYRNRGLAYAALGEHGRARRDSEEAVLLDPTLGRQ